MEIERDPDPSIIPTVAVLVIDGDRVLLVKHLHLTGHKNGIYGLPAGRKDYGEGEKEAAAREFNEETGLITREEFLIPFPHNIFTAEIERKDGVIKSFSMQVFLCKAFKGHLKATEETRPEWVKISALHKLPLLPNIEKAVENGMSFVSTLAYE